MFIFSLFAWGIFIAIIQYIFLYIMLKYVYKVEKYSPWTIFGIVIFSGALSSGFGFWSFPIYFLLVGYALSRYPLPKSKALLTALIFVLITVSLNFLSLTLFARSARDLSKSLNQQSSSQQVEFISQKDGFKVLFSTSSPRITTNPDMAPENGIRYERRTYGDAGSFSSQAVEVVDNNGQYDSIVGANDPEKEWKILQLVTPLGNVQSTKLERTNFLGLNAIRFSNANDSPDKGIVFQKNNKIYILSTSYKTQEQSDNFVSSFNFTSP